MSDLRFQQTGNFIGVAETPLSTGQVARILGITHRWLLAKLADGSYPEPQRDHRGHRMWLRRDVEAIKMMRQKEVV
jgi:hypothetical protein